MCVWVYVWSLGGCGSNEGVWFPGFRLTSAKAIQELEKWRQLDHVNTVTLIQMFTTKAFGDHCEEGMVPLMLSSILPSSPPLISFPSGCVCVRLSPSSQNFERVSFETPKTN